jgi:hypothetical protein
MERSARRTESVKDATSGLAGAVHLIFRKVPGMMFVMFFPYFFYIRECVLLLFLIKKFSRDKYK